MDNPKYVNHYIDILTGTMNDAIMRNVSFQANVNMLEEFIKEIQNENEMLKSQLQQSVDVINELQKSKNEYDGIKHQVNHLETFRNELARERDLTKRLQEELDILKTPVKRVRKPKQVDVTPEVSSEITEITDFTEEPIITQNDGGSF